MTNSLSASCLVENAWNFSEKLKKLSIHHQVTVYREDAVSITARSISGYWEIDFLIDGKIQFERFESSGIEDTSSSELEEFIKSEVGLRNQFFNPSATKQNQK